MEFSVDPKQIAVQFGLFGASYAVLKTVLFNPYVELLHLRKEKSTALKEKIAAARVRIAHLKEEYDGFLKGERKKISTWQDSERQKVAEEERAIIEKARNQVADQLSKSRKEVDDQVALARKELLPLVSDYSGRIVSKLTGKQISATAAAGGASKPNLEKSV